MGCGWTRAFWWVHYTILRGQNPMKQLPWGKQQTNDPLAKFYSILFYSILFYVGTMTSVYYKYAIAAIIGKESNRCPFPSWLLIDSTSYDAIIAYRILIFFLLYHHHYCCSLVFDLSRPATFDAITKVTSTPI